MSDDSFNPYHEWLGLDRSVQRPNHYQLLGLDPTEQNVQRIAEAASRAMAKVRSCRPGDRGSQWAQLLEQVTTAATCLTDPGRRAEYDRQLGGGPAAARSYNRPAPRSRVVPAAGGASAALPMQAPQGVPAAYPQGAAGAGGYLDPMAPVMSAGPAGAVPTYGQVPSYGAPQARPATAAPIYPSAPGQPPSGTPVAPAAGGYGYPATAPGRIPAGRPVVPVPATPAALPGRERSTASKVRSRANNSNLVILAAGAGIGMLLLAGAIVVIILSRKSDGRNGPRYAPVVRSQPIAPVPVTRPEMFHRPAPSPRPSRPVVRAPRNVVPRPETRDDAAHPVMPEAGGPDPRLNPVPSGTATDVSPSSAGEMSAKTEVLTEPTFSQPSTNLPPVSLPAGMPEAKFAPDAPLSLPAFPAGPTLGQPDEAGPRPLAPEAKPAMSDTTPEPPKPTELAAPPKPAAPAPGAAGVKPDEAAAIAKTLQAAHAAIVDGKYDAAIAELDKVASLPKLPEHHAKYERLTLLAGYAKSFQAALKSAVAGLQAGDEIEVGSSTVVGFVSAAQDSITLRVTGTNRTYSLESLPVGLAVAIADRWLKKDDPVSLAIKGAFVASLKDLDDERKAKARQWLEEASQKGVEGELHKVLDDTYDLEKDLK